MSEIQEQYSNMQSKSKDSESFKKSQQGQSTQSRSCLRSRGVCVLNIIILCIVITTIWALMLLPTVFFYLYKFSGDGGKMKVEPNVSCTPVAYNNTGTCELVLFTMHKCSSQGDTSNNESIFVPSNVDVAEVLVILNKIYLLAPSTMCEAALVPFICQYLFMPCGENNQPQYPSMDECVNIRERVCADEWKTAERFLGSGFLPICESLSSQPICESDGSENIQLECTTASNSSATSNGTLDANMPDPSHLPSCSPESDIPVMNALELGNMSVSNETAPLNCSDNFFYNKERHQCRPHCPRWTEYSTQATEALDATVIIISSLSAIMCIIVLIASCVCREQMLKFPTVFIVYQTLTVLMVTVVILISFAGREDLFCTSNDWVEVLLAKPSPFCTFSGLIFIYALWQLTIWWFLHIAFVFCGIIFLFHTRSFLKSLHSRLLWIALTIAGIVVPCIPITILGIVDDFISTRFPPYLCLSRSADAIFYTTILPLSSIYAGGVSLMVFIVREVAKGLPCCRKWSTGGNWTAAVVKLLIHFCYITVVVVFDFTWFSFSLQFAIGSLLKVGLYFECESSGLHPGKPLCPRDFNTVVGTSLSHVSIVLLSLYPFLCLLYAINTHHIRRYLTTARNTISKKIKSEP